MTLDDLRDLCDRYVPDASRHPSSRGLWWYAHEIGHLLTAPLQHIGDTLFGLFDEAVQDDTYTKHTEHELRCRELAAMSVSRRLLRAAGRPTLAQLEVEITDYTTMYWDDRGRVREILREHACLRLPRDRRGLAKKIRRVLRAARKARAVA